MKAKGKMRRDYRFLFVMNNEERELLERLAEDDHLSAGAVLRRLIFQEAERRAGEALTEVEQTIAKKMGISFRSWKHQSRQETKATSREVNNDR